MTELLSACAVSIIIVGGILLLTAAGRGRAAGAGRAVAVDLSDYNGAVRATNGPVPVFLWLLLALVVGLAMALAGVVLAGGA